MERLFVEIERFRHWAARIPLEERHGEWECNYDGWNSIYTAFDDFIEKTPCENWSNSVIQDILYIFARDNECEWLARRIATKEDLLLMLAEKALASVDADAKWQLAVQLGACDNIEAAEKLLEQYVWDEQEYVNRRVLMALAKLGSSKTETYCVLAWERDCYGELQEYQRIAVLHALYAIQSDKLHHYIALAKQDGRKYLLENALAIEKKL